MKKLLFCILFLASLAASAQAKFGLKGGLNLASIGGDASGVDMKASFHFGAFGIFKPTDKVGIMPELVYSIQGAQGTSGGTTVKFNYNYLNIPVMVNYYATEQFFIQGGLQLGFLMSAEATDGTTTVDLKDQLNGTDFGLGFGVGAELNSFLLNARYNLGLSSTSKSSGGSFPNNVLQFSVGYSF